MLNNNSRVTELLNAFSQLTYPGLEPFSQEDVDSFFNQESQFSLALNKVRGKGVLYGFDHVALRRRLVNDLPDEERLTILVAKLRFSGIFSEEDLQRIVDIRDIGMGHSVYMIQFPDKKWVLKPRDSKNQLFYCDVLTALGWPSFTAKDSRSDKGHWELSEYLEGDVLGSLFHPGACLSRAVETELAAHAALGDVLGRGDRHFENYIVSGGHIYPIDLSHLFWEDNETWVSRYISGGMAEFSSLGAFTSDAVVFCAKIESFFTTYWQTLQFLRDKKMALLEMISKHFSKDLAITYSSFISARLDNAEQYFESQKQLYRCFK